jgi:hypothetical protein
MTKADKRMMNCIILQFFMFLSIMYKVVVLLVMGHGSAKESHKNM